MTTDNLFVRAIIFNRNGYWRVALRDRLVKRPDHILARKFASRAEAVRVGNQYAALTSELMDSLTARFSDSFSNS